MKNHLFLGQKKNLIKNAANNVNLTYMLQKPRFKISCNLTEN